MIFELAHKDSFAFLIRHFSPIVQILNENSTLSMLTEYIPFCMGMHAKYCEHAHKNKGKNNIKVINLHGGTLSN